MDNNKNFVTKIKIMNKVEPLDDSFHTESTDVNEGDSSATVEADALEGDNVLEEGDVDGVDDGHIKGEEEEKVNFTVGSTPSTIEETDSPSPRPHGILKQSTMMDNKVAKYHVPHHDTDREYHLEQGHRKHDDDRMSGGTRCCFGMLMLVAQVLLHGVLALTLYWIIQYRSSKYEDGSPRPFAWREDPELEWNMHPVLMVAGFIYFMGEAMLMYRTCRCCRRIWTKLLHSIFHILAIPCIAMGFLAAWDYHSLKKNSDGESAPIQHFYSLHSWLGLATMGLFVLQFVVGFFSFLLLLCCESATASFRAALVPVHSTFGTTTFLLAIATCVAGLTEKAYFVLSDTETVEGKTFYTKYENFSGEAIFINTIGACLIGLAILVPCLVRCEGFRKGLPREGFVDAHL